jgi:hypothetical protein
MSTDGKPTHTLGILFVHGIGEQREGDTLTCFGEPLITWIRGWIRGHGIFSFREPLSKEARETLEQNQVRADGVELTTAELFPSLRQSTHPPHSIADIRITHEQNEGQRRQSWLMAECWWGEQVQPPPVFTLLAWMFSRGPWIAFAHFAERATQFMRMETLPEAASHGEKLSYAAGKFWRGAIWLPAALLFVLHAACLQLLLLIAAVIALIPIPSVRRYVSAVLQRATTILGDSYGLVANETQRAAILTRFQKTVDWLRPQCEKMVIIAHSQGAGVVGAALEDRLIKPPELLVTFGAGLVKLLQLRQCEVARRGPLLAAGWIVPSLLTAVFLTVWLKWGTDQTYWGLGLVTGMLYFSALFCTIAAHASWSATRIQSGAAPPGSRRWVDLYASSDPVPQGSLNVHLPGYDITSERIISRRSMLSDHTSYWQNRPEFVTRIAAELDQEAQLLGVPDLATSKEYKRARKHHRDAMTVLSLGWASFMISLLAWALFQPARLAATGQAALDALMGTPLEFVSRAIMSPGAFIAWIIRKLTDSTPQVLEPLGYASVALGIAAIAGYLWWKAVVVVFTKWNSASLSDFMISGTSPFWGRYGTLLVWPFMDLFALLPLAFAFCLWVEISPWIYVLQAISVVIALIYGILFAYIFLSQVPKSWPAARDLGRKLQKVLEQVTRPGAAADGAPPGSWADLASLGVFVVVACLGVGLGLGKLNITAAGFISDNAAIYGIAFVWVLLLVRLARLVRQRGYPWALGPLLLLCISLAFGLMLLAASREEMSVQSAVKASAAVSLPFLAIIYFAIFRWLPARGVNGGSPIA